MNTSHPSNTAAPASREDWHPADIVAALRKAGWSLRRLSVHHNLCPTALSRVTQSPWPKGERLIAEAIGIPPEEIWPDRHAKRLERIARRDQRAAEGLVSRPRRRSANPSPTA
ncbi:helix-turn-helix domain-containing protein [Thiocapsa roseopersicina]|uniref:helix-turn-helix domain-containing protein n=1 Tax=Thiocapsa roseopersicina TaxID=1058 RepID=UPI000B8937FD|nr:helix-turn-helix transcriptional regulator [Thiocapsa roseopersicina]